MILPVLLLASFAAAAQPRGFVDRLEPAERKKLAAAILSVIDDKLVLDQEKRHHLKEGDEKYELYLLSIEGRLLKAGHKRWVPLPAWDPDGGVPVEFAVAKAKRGGRPRAAPKHKRMRRFAESLPLAGGPLCAIRDEKELDAKLSRWHDFVMEEMGGSADSEESAAVPLVWCWHAYLAELKSRWRACTP